MLSVDDNLCKQFNTLMVCLNEFLEKVDFEKNQKKTKKHIKIPSRQRVIIFFEMLLIEKSVDNFKSLQNYQD